jgi:outer membrane receptor protein involved in Fe transport
VLWNVAPRARASIRVVRPLRVIAAYGRGFRPPEARAFTSQQAPALGVSQEAAQPTSPRFTRTHSLELGTRYRPAAWLGADLTGFATLISRESIFDHVSGLNLELNGSRRVGGELVLSASPVPWLRLMADVTAVDARFRESGRRVPLAPWLTSGARLVLSHPSGFDAGLRFLAVAPRPLPHGARGEALYLFDASCGYRYRWFSLSLALENLLSRALREGEYHYASHWPGDAERSHIPTLQYMAGPPFNARLTLALAF